MRILVFTVQGVTLGVDTSQIEEMLEVGEAAARGLPIRPIHEEFSFGALPMTYHAPKVITIKGHRDPLAALIDRPEDIADVNVDSIQCVPPLIAERPGATEAIWGVIVRDGNVILLVDFLKLRPRTASAQEKTQA